MIINGVLFKRSLIFETLGFLRSDSRKKVINIKNSSVISHLKDYISIALDQGTTKLDLFKQVDATLLEKVFDGKSLSHLRMHLERPYSYFADSFSTQRLPNINYTNLEYLELYIKGLRDEDMMSLYSMVQTMVNLRTLSLRIASKDIGTLPQLIECLIALPRLENLSFTSKSMIRARGIVLFSKLKQLRSLCFKPSEIYLDDPNVLNDIDRIENLEKLTIDYNQSFFKNTIFQLCDITKLTYLEVNHGGLPLVLLFMFLSKLTIIQTLILDLKSWFNEGASDLVSIPVVKFNYLTKFSLTHKNNYKSKALLLLLERIETPKLQNLYLASDCISTGYLEKLSSLHQLTLNFSFEILSENQLLSDLTGSILSNENLYSLSLHLSCCKIVSFKDAKRFSKFSKLHSLTLNLHGNQLNSSCKDDLLNCLKGMNNLHYINLDLSDKFPKMEVKEKKGFWGFVSKYFKRKSEEQPFFSNVDMKTVSTLLGGLPKLRTFIFACNQTEIINLHFLLAALKKKPELVRTELSFNFCKIVQKELLLSMKTSLNSIIQEITISDVGVI